MIRPTDRETVSTGNTVCSSQAPGAGSHVIEATAESEGAGRRWGWGQRWGRVFTGLLREGTAEAGEQAVEIVVVSPGALGCLQLSGTCLGT